MTARFLRFFAVVLLISTIALWIFTGANTGRTEMEPSAATSKNATEAYMASRKSFHPGMEFLVGNAALAVVVFALSFAARKKS